jgi:ABC-type Zn uptake system ZnuABC Zn-binding protein ZnuA
MNQIRRNAGRVLAGGLGLLFLATGCQRAPDVWGTVPGGSLRLVTSIPPLYCFVQKVAGPQAKVLCLVTHTGPHDFHPTTLDYLKLQDADLFFANGLGLDDWVADLAQRAHNSRLRVVRLGEAVPRDRLLPRAADAAEDTEEGHLHQGLYDPHVWLSPPEVMFLVERIREVLQLQDPAHAGEYAARAAAYRQELEQLYAEGRQLLAGKKNRKLVATHDAFRYLARAFDLELVGSIQPQPGIETDAKRLADLAERCRREQVRVVLVEPQYSPSAAQALTRQLAGGRMTIVPFDPLETVAGPLDPDYYIRTLRDNLRNLARHLE